MTFVDLAIIYLACGAPLSMHYFFAADRKPALLFAARIVLVSLCWPVAVFLLIRDVRERHLDRQQTGQNELDRLLDPIRVEIENLAFDGEIAATVFEFRELFARYTGLVQAANAEASNAGENELFKLSSHSNGDLATLCLERKAKNRLLIHAESAREDLVSFISAAMISADQRLLKSATILAETLGDREAVLRIAELCPFAAKDVEQGIGSRSAIPASAR